MYILLYEYIVSDIKVVRCSMSEAFNRLIVATLSRPTVTSPELPSVDTLVHSEHAEMY